LASVLLLLSLKEFNVTKLEKIIYTAQARTTGGRDGGSSRTSDGRLEVTLSRPGGAGNGTNPEQLLAAGWSACFLSAMKMVAGKKKIALPDDTSIDAEIDLGVAQGVHKLAARLHVNLPGLDKETASSLVDAAAHVCPYSLATSGNIDVKYNVMASEPAETQHA
jgi:Ohr subfamily peroxiredoxin